MWGRSRGNMSAIFQGGDFKVAEAIKGNAVPGSTISIEVAQRSLHSLKKDEELIFFVSNHSALQERGPEQAADLGDPLARPMTLTSPCCRPVPALWRR